MEPVRKLRRWRRRCVDHRPAAVRHGGAVSVSGRPGDAAGLQASRVVHKQRAAVRPPSRRRTVQHEQQLPSTGADGLRQHRLAQGGHSGPGQDRTGQTQGVRVPQDPVPAHVQAQDVPDHHVIKVPVDRQADEAVKAVYGTVNPANGGAVSLVPVLGPDAHQQPALHPF